MCLCVCIREKDEEGEMGNIVCDHDQCVLALYVFLCNEAA